MMVLLEYINLLMTYMNNIVDTYYYIDIMLLILQAHNTEILGMHIQSCAPFV